MRQYSNLSKVWDSRELATFAAGVMGEARAWQWATVGVVLLLVEVPEVTNSHHLQQLRMLAPAFKAIKVTCSAVVVSRATVELGLEILKATGDNKLPAKVNRRNHNKLGERSPSHKM